MFKMGAYVPKKYHRFFIIKYKLVTIVITVTNGHHYNKIIERGGIQHGGGIKIGGGGENGRCGVKTGGGGVKMGSGGV